MGREEDDDAQSKLTPALKLQMRTSPSSAPEMTLESVRRTEVLRWSEKGEKEVNTTTTRGKKEEGDAHRSFMADDGVEVTARVAVPELR